MFSLPPLSCGKYNCADMALRPFTVYCFLLIALFTGRHFFYIPMVRHHGLVNAILQTVPNQWAKSLFLLNLLPLCTISIYI
jgi:hypothetical protein